MSTAHLRTEYRHSALDEADAGDEPYGLFGRWFAQAVDAGGRDPNAMSLATCDAQGQPAVRIVLCKEFDERGFVFYTNRESRKGHELAANPQASLLFYWADLERQVRIEGRVAAVSESEADAYFAERPRAARIGAWASPQSQVLPDREELGRRVAAATLRFAGQEHPPRPPHWGGYRLSPAVIEFWQGRESRLHDRLRFRQAGGRWLRERLAP